MLAFVGEDEEVLFLIHEHGETLGDVAELVKQETDVSGIIFRACGDHVHAEMEFPAENFRMAVASAQFSLELIRNVVNPAEVIGWAMIRGVQDGKKALTADIAEGMPHGTVSH